METRLPLHIPRFASDFVKPAPGCAGMWTGFVPGECSVVRAFGGGFISPWMSETTVPPDHIGIASLEALLGADSSFAQDGFLRFTVDLRYQRGSFDAVRAAFRVSGPHADAEERAGVSDE